MKANHPRLKILPIVVIGIVSTWVLVSLVMGGARYLRNQIVFRLPVSVPGIAPCPDCNILLINLDSLRASELACYGYTRDTAPNVCKFAKDNILFSRFYTQSSFTLDSHMSIFTGLYPSTHHVLEALKDSLSPEILTFPEVLKRHGYRTVWAGVTDDINLPLDRGLGRGFSEIYSVDGQSPTWKDDYQKLLPKFLDDQPTFMFLHTYGVHAPYLPGPGPRRFVTGNFPAIPVTIEGFRAHSRPFYEFVLSEFQDRLTVSNTKESRERNAAIVRGLEKALNNNDVEAARNVIWSLPSFEGFNLYFTWYYMQADKDDQAVVAYIQGLYDERIYQVDEQLEPLFAFLNRADIKRKTIVIILSDNGEEFTEHGYFDHAWNIYDQATHAPLIMAVPRMRGGSVYHELIQAVDIYPTLLELVGIKSRARGEGKSLVPILEGKGEQQVGEAYVIGQHRGTNIVSIRNRRWKMYKNNTPEQRFVEFYDLLTDPEEQHNVLGKHLGTARLLDEALTRILSASPKYASVSGEFPGWVDEEKRRKLIEEGYF